MPIPSKMDNSDNLISKIKPRIHANRHEENESVHSRQLTVLKIVCSTMRSSQKEIIAELQTLNFQSIEFYSVATRYFSVRYRIIRNCGLFFIFLAGLSLVLVFISEVSWIFKITNLAGSCLSAMIGRATFRIGTYGIGMIKTARKADGQHQINALHIAASSKPFRGDPIGKFVLQQLKKNGRGGEI